MPTEILQNTKAREKHVAQDMPKSYRRLCWFSFSLEEETKWKGERKRVSQSYQGETWYFIKV